MAQHPEMKALLAQAANSGKFEYTNKLDEIPEDKFMENVRQITESKPKPKESTESSRFLKVLIVFLIICCYIALFYGYRSNILGGEEL